MDDDHRNLQMRVEILSAYVAVTDDPIKLLSVCANVTGDASDEIAAVTAALELGGIPARAVLDLQVRRFTPRERLHVRDELVDLQRRYALRHP